MGPHSNSRQLNLWVRSHDELGSFDRWAKGAGYSALLGVDEVGRGCLAGPVVAAAVALPPDHGIVGLDDSKRVSLAQRIRLDKEIRALALALGIGQVEAEEIDQINILQASLKAMAQAVDQACGPGFVPDLVVVDGNCRLPIGRPQRTVIGGDARCVPVAAASIVAKVYRDSLMTAASSHYPQYGFERHVGYATVQHRTALQQLGPCPLHRRSFQPVAAAFENFRNIEKS